SSDLGELARCGRLDDLAGEPLRKAHALALDVRARIAEQPEGIRVAPELEPDLLEDRVGVLLDQRQTFVVEDLERSEGACQERLPGDVRPGAGSLAAGPAARSLARRFVDRHRSSFAAVTAARRRLVPPSGRPSARGADRAGRAVTRDRCVEGAVRWGNAMASTKCSWKRGSTAVSIFSTR